MKKIILVMTTVLAMLLFMAFTCYGQGIDACYQKNDGQLRILTHNKNCDKDHNKNCDKDHDKDCDKDGYTNKCKPSEIAITLQGGGQIPEVPRICAAYIAGSNCDTTTNTCPFTGSCVSSVLRTQAGYYNITFTTDFTQPPICVIYLYQNTHQLDLVLYSEILSTTKTGFTLNTYYIPSDGGTFDVDNDFNFICTEP